MKKKLRILIFKGGNVWWVAQCLEYGIAAQERSSLILLYSLKKQMFYAAFENCVNNVLKK